MVPSAYKDKCIITIIIIIITILLLFYFLLLLCIYVFIYFYNHISVSIRQAGQARHGTAKPVPRESGRTSGRGTGPCPPALLLLLGTEHVTLWWRTEWVTEHVALWWRTEWVNGPQGPWPRRLTHGAKAVQLVAAQACLSSPGSEQPTQSFSERKEAGKDVDNIHRWRVAALRDESGVNVMFFSSPFPSLFFSFGRHPLWKTKN